MRFVSPFRQGRGGSKRHIDKNKLNNLPSVLLDVAVGDFGKRPHITASAVCLYF